VATSLAAELKEALGLEAKLVEERDGEIRAASVLWPER